MSDPTLELEIAILRERLSRFSPWMTKELERLAVELAYDGRGHISNELTRIRMAIEHALEEVDT